MKKMHRVSSIICIALVACVCVLGFILLRQNYCKVTFVCETGCQHVAWFHKGEVADTSVVAQAHHEEIPVNHACHRVFLDKERLLYVFDQPLTTSKVTYYIRSWDSSKEWSQAFQFDTPLGDIMVFITEKDTQSEAEYYSALEERFFDAYERLGGHREDTLYFTFRFAEKKEWYTLSQEQAYAMHANVFACIANVYVARIPGRAGAKLGYVYDVEKILVVGEPDNADNS